MKKDRYTPSDEESYYVFSDIVYLKKELKPKFDFLNEKTLPEKSVFVSQYFNILSQSHNVKHELHGYDGFYKANIEYVIYNLLNNLYICLRNRWLLHRYEYDSKTINSI